MDRNLPPRPPDPLVDSLPELQDFSLVLGGPLYQLIRRTHLDDDVMSHLRRRIAVICGIIWLPMLGLCAAGGTLLKGIEIPFLGDVETHARFLVAVPLMILAELIVHQRMRGIVAQFVERKLIPAGSMERFREAIISAMKWRNSIPIELALVAIVYPLGYYIRADLFALKVSTWYAAAGTHGATLTLSGFWFTWGSNSLKFYILTAWCSG
ncbi:MAG: hypothetical protein NTW21_43655 [Verrucomicrobia bacterium]|nr:hypothetical protein [Verrucomicrobiota bacterium]